MNSPSYIFDRFIDLKINFTQQTTQISKLPNPAQTKVRTTYTEQRSLQLSCPRKGMKPSIALTYKRVPQDFCYQATLTVTNLILPVPPQWVDDFDVTLGYTSGDSDKYYVRLKFTVFSSYSPEPGPDGTTVFECIVGGAGASLLTEKHFELSLFNDNPDTQKPWKISEVLKFALETKAGLALRMYMSNPDQLDFSSVDIPKVTFKSTYQLINWLQQQINAALKPSKHVVTTAIFNDEVFFIEIDEKGQAIDTNTIRVMKEIPVLDLVESVEWNSGILTVVAPFVPQITPGKVFKINPSYYKASIGLPNTVARQTSQKSEMDLYTVITQQVSFSTDADNRMTLTAVPIKDAAINNQEAEATKKTFDQLKTELIDTIPIPFNGASNPKQLKAQKEYKDLDDLYISTSSFGTQNYYKIGVEEHRAIDAGGLSSIAVAQNLPELKGKLAKADKKSITVPASIAWIPYILVLTNSRYKELKQQKSTYSASWQIDVAAPDKLDAGHWLIIPNQDWSTVAASPYLSQILDAYDICADYYTKKLEPSYAAELRRAKQILETGEVE